MLAAAGVSPGNVLKPAQQINQAPNSPESGDAKSPPAKRLRSAVKAPLQPSPSQAAQKDDDSAMAPIQETVKLSPDLELLAAMFGTCKLASCGQATDA